MAGRNRIDPRMFVRMGLMDDSTLGEYVQRSRDEGVDVIKLLLGDDKIQRADLHRAHALSNGWRFVDVGELEISKDVTEFISPELARRLTAVPVAEEDGSAVIAVSNPGNPGVRAQLNAAISRPVVLAYAPHKALVDKVEELYSATREAADVARSQETAARRSAAESVEQDLGYLAGDSGGIIKIVDLIIERAVHLRTSDIHVDRTEGGGALLRYRIDGSLQNVDRYPPTTAAGIVNRIKTLARMSTSEQRLPQDGRITVFPGGEKRDVRVASLPGTNGEKMTMRILDSSMAKKPLSSLGFSERNMELYLDAISKPNGIVFVTGPVNSGKSTTMYSSLGHIAKETENILTIEDPVEYQFDGMTQVQVHEEIGMTFAAALKTFLRHDPDVVLLGETRDSETANAAVQVSLSGRFVLSTLHTNSAPLSVPRLINLGLKPYQISASLNAVLAQRLIKRLCEHCKVPVGSDFVESAAGLGFQAPSDLDGVFQRSDRGCDECRGLGYRGLLPIHELMVVDRKIREAIDAEASVSVLDDLARQQGMTSLLQDGWEKVLSGVTDLPEIVTAAAE